MTDVERLAEYNRLELEASERKHLITIECRKAQSELTGITDLHELWSLKRRLRDQQQANLKKFRRSPKEFYKLVERL
jgi:hypothetical protein